MKYYVHIPFCHAKCAYCDFYSMPRIELAEAFVNALEGEICGRVGGIGDVETLYLGGGTPSSLPLGLLNRVISFFPIDEKLRELTVETNPEDVTEEYAGFIASLGPSARVSMGVQSLDDSLLSFIGRRHTAAGAVEAYRLLRMAGIPDISLDLIYGLPGQDMDSWKKSLDGVIALRPDHLSAYLMTYEPTTRLGVMLSQGRVEECSEELAVSMYDYLCAVAREAGYVHYEISNFALPGKEALHNSSYWDGSEYIGLGPGAHSYVRGSRGADRPSLKEYIATSGCGVYETEYEDDDSRFNDLVITALRTARGISRQDLSLSPGSLRQAELMLSDGLLVETAEGRLAIPEHIWLRSDAIMLELIRI